MIDDKLREIITNSLDYGTTEDAIIRIKQAFADEQDTEHLDRVKTYLEAKGYMTGQEWYDRFEKELTGFDMTETITKFVVLKAAKKASGLL